MTIPELKKLEKDQPTLADLEQEIIRLGPNATNDNIRQILREAWQYGYQAGYDVGFAVGSPSRGHA